MNVLKTRIYLIGMMGAGKSYWARRLGEHYGVPWFDTDQLIEEKEGKTIREIFEPDHGAATFRAMEKTVLQETSWPEGCIISCGGGLPCYHNNMEYMLETGKVIWLNPDVSVLAGRLWKEKSHRPLVEASRSREDLEARIGKLIAERKPFYSRAHALVEAAFPVPEDFFRLIDPN